MWGELYILCMHIEFAVQFWLALLGLHVWYSCRLSISNSLIKYLCLVTIILNHGICVNGIFGLAYLCFGL